MDRMKGFLQKQRGDASPSHRRALIAQLAANDCAVTSVEVGRDASSDFVREMCGALRTNTNVRQLRVSHCGDADVLDALGELLSQSQGISTLRLTRCGADDAALMPLFGVLLQRSAICSICLEGNRLREGGALASLLRYARLLEQLDIANNALDEAALQQIAAAVRDTRALHTLNIGGNPGVTERTVTAFVDALQRPPPSEATRSSSSRSSSDLPPQAAPALRSLDIGRTAAVLPETRQALLQQLELRAAGERTGGGGGGPATSPAPLSARSTSSLPHEKAATRHEKVDEGEQERENEEAQAAAPGSRDGESSPRTPLRPSQPHAGPATDTANGGGACEAAPWPGAAMCPTALADRITTLERENAELRRRLEEAESRTVAVERHGLAAGADADTTRAALGEALGLLEAESAARTTAEAQLKEARERLAAQDAVGREQAAQVLKMDVELNQLRDAAGVADQAHIRERTEMAQRLASAEEQLEAAEAQLAMVVGERHDCVAELVAGQQALLVEGRRVAELQAALAQAVARALPSNDLSASPAAAAPTSDASTNTALTLLGLEGRRRRRAECKERLRFQRALSRNSATTPPAPAARPAESQGANASFRGGGGGSGGGGAAPGTGKGNAARARAETTRDRRSGELQFGLHGFVAVDAADVDPAFEPMTKQHWEQDDLVNTCGCCSVRFGLVERKHHCRRCGRIFCNKCCPKSKLHNDVRICSNCVNSRTRGDSMFANRLARVSEI